MKKNAIALISGGIDSIIACKIAIENKMDIIGIHFASPLFPEVRLRKISDFLKIRIISQDISADMLKVISKNITGKNLDPCLECRLLIYRNAEKIRNESKIDFIITGEVFGQNPKTQSKKAMKYLEGETKTSGIIIRPLTEICTGKSRSEQAKLALKFGVPRDLISSEKCSIKIPDYKARICGLLKIKKLNAADLLLSRIGKHLTTGKKNIVIIARNRDESENLQKLAGENDHIFSTATHLLLFMGELSEDEIINSAKLIARNMKKKGGNNVAYYRAGDRQDKHSVIV